MRDISPRFHLHFPARTGRRVSITCALSLILPHYNGSLLMLKLCFELLTSIYDTLTHHLPLASYLSRNLTSRITSRPGITHLLG